MKYKITVSRESTHSTYRVYVKRFRFGIFPFWSYVGLERTLEEALRIEAEHTIKVVNK